mgnify:FL=1
MNLYELTSELSKMLDEFSTCDDTDRLNALEAEIAKQAENVEAKVEACCIVYKNLRAQATAREIEITRLKAQLERIEGGMSRLETWIRVCATTGKKWDVGAHRLKWRPSERCIVKVPVEELPPVYIKEKIVKSANVEELKKDLKVLREENKTLPFAELQKHFSLVIE